MDNRRAVRERLRKLVLTSPEPILVVVDFLTEMGMRAEAGFKHGHPPGHMVIVDTRTDSLLPVVVSDHAYREDPHVTAIALLVHVLSWQRDL